MTKHSGSQLLAVELPEDLTSQIVDMINGLPNSVKSEYLKAELMSKFVSSQTDAPETRRQRAINKWLATERDNEATNDRLLTTPEDVFIFTGVRLGYFVEQCRELIRNTIGDTVPVDALIGSFSGGASTSRSRAASYPSSKYFGKAHVTETCLPIFHLISDEMPGWLGTDPLEIETVSGNVLFTVPKKTDIDRVACKEPDLNMFLQKGIGTYFRKMLRRVRINLNDQSVNRSLAQFGSENGSLATLDLSSASDSISEGLVAHLLPVTWYTFLDSVRSQVTIIDGEEHRNHMFSSMGNGFTFELESLIFWALAETTRRLRYKRGVISVYGDDIICPIWMYDDLVRVLDFFGFSVNTEKSFSSGPFRESCGGHFWHGYDITPFYIREPITKMSDLIRVANQLRLWGSSDASKSNFLRSPGHRCDIIDLDVESIWLNIRQYIPSCLWGGHDPAFIYQLVCEYPPSMRIQPSSRRKDTGVGGYYHWLNATWARTESLDGISTSRVTHSSPAKERVRKVRDSAVPRLQSIFLHEV